MYDIIEEYRRLRSSSLDNLDLLIRISISHKIIIFPRVSSILDICDNSTAYITICHNDFNKNPINII